MKMDRQAGRQTDMIKLIVTFHNFVTAPENASWSNRPFTTEM
jgi:hypothetical protein